MHEKLRKTVGRPREFDEETVLEAVMEAFWRKGYEATSLAELCHVTGLNKGSLYQAFGDKRRLFMRALTHYAERQYREVMAAASRSESPLVNIRAAVRKICDHAGSDKGCMMINTLVELAPHDPEVKALLKSFGEKRMQALAGMISAAQHDGEIRAALDPRKLARQLMMALAGAATMAKGFMPGPQIGAALSELIDSWT
jgi:TetR/AcrR family transcriptional repressor of nem operon